MKVRELIEKLSEYDPEWDVVVAGYEYGADDVKDIWRVQLYRDVHGEGEWYGGRHEISDRGYGSQEPAPAVYIHGRHNPE